MKRESTQPGSQSIHFTPQHQPGRAARWGCGLLLAGQLLVGAAESFHQWALTPPMGWNSWDCFATTVTEVQTKAQTDYMAEHLKAHGWQYIVVDIQWYEPNAKNFAYRKNAALVTDEFGRLWPATNRFPSAANGVGFKTLADYVHGKGLRFGIHLMRGIPRQAVRDNTPIKGTNVRACDIANTNSICQWNPDMFGVDMTKAGAQAYYDSVFELIASWGADYVKVDDIARPYHTNEKEIEAVRRAIDRSGRAMVLSLSPGETALTAATHVATNANLWRISDDFWDSWPALHEQFARLRNWTSARGPGHWPDADMLPLGVLDMGKRKTHFTPDEQYTLMTLWSIARSPLMHGGDMTKMEDLTLSLLTNDEVLAVNQNSTGNRELFHRGDFVAWIADVPESSDRYLALFHAPPGKFSGTNAAGQMAVDLADAGFVGKVRVRDLWSHRDLGEFETRFAAELPAHGAGLFRLSGTRAVVREEVQDDKMAPANGKPSAGGLPALFLIGDSTVKNGSERREGGLWGWGECLAAQFDTNKIRMVNRAIGGRSSRTFFTEGRWERVMEELYPGDFVLMQFGHNDGGSLDDARGRASIKGTGDETQAAKDKDGKLETVHSYGWYLRQYIAGAKARGATPIVCSPIPRNLWRDGKVARAANDYGKWARESAESGGAQFIDLNELIARRYEAQGSNTVVTQFFTEKDHTHTTKAGAELNAACVAEGVTSLSDRMLAGLLQTSLTIRPDR